MIQLSLKMGGMKYTPIIPKNLTVGDVVNACERAVIGKYESMSVEGHTDTLRQLIVFKFKYSRMYLFFMTRSYDVMSIDISIFNNLKAEHIIIDALNRCRAKAKL